MAALTDTQKQSFHDNGYLVVEDAVDAGLLQRLRQDFDGWVADSAGHDAPFGETVDGRPRFDLQPPADGKPAALRRVQAPTEVSDAYYEAMADSRMTDMVADLIGPNIKLHHTKINSKQPGAATMVKWHQDFAFTPHSNADLITALLMIDDVDETNGPLAVAPGSHKGPIHSIWQDGVFTGAVAPEIEADMKRQSTLCMGKAGSVCLMHTRLAHGSEPNLSSRPRTLFICVYSAGDAMPCTPNPVPTRHMGLFVRGTDPHRVRGEAYDVAVPEYPKTSFFAQQSDQERRA
ncbi:MAG: phytanoyl-CoA dioxygenase family protein [Alphaproteobacteria bacterium]|nr:phytanoyl-CoA dioxygenase family protein [Alphaproteobacteria bacterium]